jgi:hypothetical protein
MMKIVSVAIIFLALPVTVIAAPFCLVVPSGTPECIYYDGAACSRDANRQNGSCQTNPDEVRVPASRIGEYCLTMPNGTSSCGYVDPYVCGRDALAQKGACSRSAGAPPRAIPDPYAPNAGR